jgi:hypothetical protein
VRFAASAALLLLGSGCTLIAGIGPHTFDGGTDADAAAERDPPDASQENGDGPCPLIVGPEFGSDVRRWRAVSWAVYVVPAGYADDVLVQVWQPNHAPDPTLGPKSGLFKSSIAHASGYDTELAEGLARASHVSSGCLDLSGASVSSEVIVSVVLAPAKDSDLGTSFDVKDQSIPVIDDSLLPTARLFRDQKLVVPSVLPNNEVPRTKFFYRGFDGETHRILNWGQDQQLPWLPGSYEFQVRIESDTSTSWTTQSVFFRVR